MAKKIKNQVKAAGMTAVSVVGVVSPFLSAIPVSAAELTVQNGTVNAGHTATTTAHGETPADAVLTINGQSQQSLKNKKFVLYKIFDAENAKTNESINYTFNPKYKEVVQEVVAKAVSKRDGKTIEPQNVSEYLAIDYMASLDKNQVEGALTEKNKESSYSDYRYFVEDLKNAIIAKGLDGDTVTVQSLAEGQNTISITGLSWGYYFVDEVSTGDDVTNGQEGSTEDGRKTSGLHYASSLVMVDTVNNKATMTVKSDFPTITKKIKEDDSNVGKNSDGWNDIGDFEIGQTIDYRYDLTLPNMNGYHGYYFNIVDKADKELTMITDSKDNFKIKISDGSKTYEVKSSEFELGAKGNVTTEQTETTVSEGATFNIEFDDLQSLVDREFNKIDPKTQENDYSNLTMSVEYQGFINDTAQDKTGRPGFENHVKLIYSNDPDSTGKGKNNPNNPPGDNPKGETPWDTVVAFTYKLNSIKTNQDGYKLGDAEFKLYEDEAMTKEIKVKQVKGQTAATQADTNPVIDTEVREGVTKDHTTTEETDNKLNTEADITEANRYIVMSNDGENNQEEGAIIKSDANGNFVITGLDSGTYYLKETKAPAGYRLLEKPIKLEIKASFAEDRDSYIPGDGATDKALKALAAKGLINEFYEGIFKSADSDLKTDVESGTVNANVVNQKLPKLPVTGSTLQITVFASATALVLAGVFTAMKRRESKETN